MNNQGPDVSGRKRVAKGAPPDPYGRKPGQFAPENLDKGPLSLDQDEWLGIDVPEEDRAEWRDAGFTADEADQWYNCGFSAYYAREWTDNAFNDPYEADQWSAYGFKAEEAASWYDAGFTSLDEDHPELWRDTLAPVLRPDQEKHWHAKEWRDAGFNHAQALSWIEEGVLDPQNAKAEAQKTGNKFHHLPEMYAKHTLSELAMLDSVTGSWLSPYGLYGGKDWERLGFSPDAAKAWANTGISPASAAELRERYAGRWLR